MVEETFCLEIMFSWMDDLQFYVLVIGIPVISRRWRGKNQIVQEQKSVATLDNTFALPKE